MGNQRRRGRSVVFDSMPSLITTEDDDSSLLSRGNGRFGAKLTREAVREIILVLVGLILVVWLFFGGGDATNKDYITLAGRPVLGSESPLLVPAHFAGSGSARDSVKKAPGDKQGNAPGDSKQGMASVDGTAAKKRAPALYQFTGEKSPQLVILTVLDDKRFPREYVERVLENRVEYAQARGFGLLVKFVSDFQKFVDNTHNHNPSWARVALAQEAQISFPGAEWFWFLDETALIMEPAIDPLTEILPQDRLEPLMRRQVPVMRYVNTHIMTYANNRVEDVSLIFCQDTWALNTDSFFFRNNFAAKAWLEMWGEPLYRSFTRFGNEEEALGHMMQWHTQFLVRGAVIDTRKIGAITSPETTDDEMLRDLSYQPGDFVAILTCDYATESCKREFQRKWNDRHRATASAQNQAKDGLRQGAKDEVQAQVQVAAQEQAQKKAEQQAEKNMQAF